MPRLQLKPCDACRQKINDLMGAHGKEAIIQAAPSILADCPACQKQIPDELRAALQAGRYEAREKGTPAPETFVEKGRIVIP